MTKAVVGNAIGVNSSLSSLALGVCLLYSEPQKLILGNGYVSVKKGNYQIRQAGLRDT